MNKEIFANQIVMKFSDTGTFFKKIKNNLEFFKQIKIIRKYLSMTQKQLSKRAGIKQPIISKIESGDSNITIKQLEKVAEGLCCDLQVVLTPKKQLNQIKSDQIEKVAKFLVKSGLNNIALEGHYLNKKNIDNQLNILKQNLLNNPKGIWND